jgi:hypothetical protein
LRTSGRGTTWTTEHGRESLLHLFDLRLLFVGQNGFEFGIHMLLQFRQGSRLFFC